MNDNFTADYVSQAIGQTSNLTSKGERDEANARQLVTADELRRSSGDYIFAFIESNPVTYFAKMPYYNMQELAKGLIKIHTFNCNNINYNGFCYVILLYCQLKYNN